MEIDQNQIEKGIGGKKTARGASKAKIIRNEKTRKDRDEQAESWLLEIEVSWKTIIFKESSIS